MTTDILWQEQLDSILSSKECLILVDFRAERCGPCRMLTPILHDLAQKYWEKIHVVKINVDEDQNRDISMKYAVRSIPQVTLFKNNEVVDQFVWALPPDQIEALIDKHI